MEKENQGNGNKALLLVIGAATFITAMVGATFAYFSATSTSDEKTVTTATSNLTVTATNNSVENIRPTTWNEGNKDTDTEIVKMTVSVDGTSTASGRYSLTMNQPTISIASIASDQGAVGDFKWAAYDEEGNQLVAPTSMAASQTNTLIPGKDKSGYTNDYTATGDSPVTIDDEYYVYVWIENKNADQNNLQEVSFDLTFTGSGTTSTN